MTNQTITTDERASSAVFAAADASAMERNRNAGPKPGLIRRETMTEWEIEDARRPMTYWAAVLDGDIEGADLRETRAAAEADARWLRGHPARHDRMTFGYGGVIRVMRVVEDEWTGEIIEVGI